MKLAYTLVLTNVLKKTNYEPLETVIVDTNTKENKQKNSTIPSPMENISKSKNTQNNSQNTQMQDQSKPTSAKTQHFSILNEFGKMVHNASEYSECQKRFDTNPIQPDDPELMVKQLHHDMPGMDVPIKASTVHTDETLRNQGCSTVVLAKRLMCKIHNRPFPTERVQYANPKVDLESKEHISPTWSQEGTPYFRRKKEKQE